MKALNKINEEFHADVDAPIKPDKANDDTDSKEKSKIQLIIIKKLKKMLQFGVIILKRI